MKLLNRIKKHSGFSLIELMVVIVIMTFLSVAVMQVTVNTVKVMMMGIRQDVAQSSVEQVVNRMAEDIRTAGSDGLTSIIAGGAQAITFRRYENMEIYNESSDDLNLDIACYSFVGSQGTNPYDAGFMSGYIRGGSGTGADTSCMYQYQLTDPGADVRMLSFEYCRPDASANGAYVCSSKEIDNSNVSDYIQQGDDEGIQPVDIYDTSVCVWLVRISVDYARVPVAKSDTIDPAAYSAMESSYQTTVMLRNPYIMSVNLDRDKDGIVDCCDATYVKDDIDWCPPPRDA